MDKQSLPLRVKTTSPEITVIICTYNTKDITLKCLDNLKKSINFLSKPVDVIVVVAVPPAYRLDTTDKFVVDAPPFSVASPVLVNAPVLESEVKDPAPAVKASAPILMEPKLAVMEPESRTPTVVRDEVMIPEPRVVEVRTSEPSIWYLV